MKIKKTTKKGKREYKEPVYVIEDSKIRLKPRRRRAEQPAAIPVMPPTMPSMPTDFSAIEQMTPEQATALIMQMMGDQEKISMHSELTDDRVVNIMAIQTIGKQYDIPLLEDIPNILLPLLVSKDRQGRRELIDMIKAWSSGKAQMGMMDRLRGLF